MRMATIQEAQTALAEFDRKHWPHAPGAATVQHTFFHLYVSPTDVSWSATLADIDDAGWLADHIVAKRGVLIEHALRLANVVGLNLAGWLCGGGLDRELYWLKRQRALALRDPTSCSFPALIFGLGPLARVCEETGHGQYARMPSVMAIAQALMECAARSSPPNVRASTVEFLKPFAVWLAQLEQRFSSQPVPT